MASTILSMPEIHLDTNSGLEELELDSVRQMDYFFWEILPATGYARMLNLVKPMGGIRKFQAVIHALGIGT